MALLPGSYGANFIDISWRGVLETFFNMFTLKDSCQIQNEIEEMLGGSAEYLVSLSVRSAFDLFLTAMKFPTGCEIIMSAVNIGDMAKIASYHGLVVKPIDLQLLSLEPNYHQLRQSISPKTVLILVTHLYGKRFNNRTVVEIARHHNILLAEDCAQAFTGPKCLSQSGADVAFYSFGSIKHTTCFGGAISVVRDTYICNRMRSVQSQYHVQPRWIFYRKLCRYASGMFIINVPFILWMFLRLIRMVGFDNKKVALAVFGGFPGDLKQQIRYTPCTPQLILLKKRLENYSIKDREDCLEKINNFINCLRLELTYLPGYNKHVEHHWLFPVLVDDPDAVVKELIHSGVEAAGGATQLIAVEGTQPTSEKDKQESTMTYKPVGKATFNHVASHSSDALSASSWGVTKPSSTLHTPLLQCNSDLISLDEKDGFNEMSKPTSHPCVDAKFGSECTMQLLSHCEHEDSARVEGIEYSPNHKKDYEIPGNLSSNKEHDKIVGYAVQVYASESPEVSSQSIIGTKENSCLPQDHIDYKEDTNPSFPRTLSSIETCKTSPISVPDSYAIRSAGTGSSFAKMPVISEPLQNNLACAKFLIDHVIYLPVHKRCPPEHLDFVAKVFNEVISRRQSVRDKAKLLGVNLGSKL